MFSGLKFIPREQVEREEDNDGDVSYIKQSKKSGRRKKEKDRRRKKKKSSGYSSSSDDEGLEKIKKGSRKKKKWYASDEDIYSDTDGSKSENESEYEEERKRHRKGKGKKERRKRRHEYSSGSGSDDSSGKERHRRGGDKESANTSRDDKEAESYGSLARKEMGLDWMLRPKDTSEKIPMTKDDQVEEAPAEEVMKVNPREMNPYLKDNGNGFPDDPEGTGTVGNTLMSAALVGDGGASWRLKALRRAQEQAAREGRQLEEVVGDRWGSLSQLAGSVATHKAAPTRAHLHAIKNRRKGLEEEEQTATRNDSEKVESVRHPRMKVPRHNESLSWGKRKVSSEDAGVVSVAISELNKFKDDGSFMSQFMQPKNGSLDCRADASYAKSDRREESSSMTTESRETRDVVTVGKPPPLSSNQLAAKVMQLRLKGKHDEAEKLLREVEAPKVARGIDDELRGPQIDVSTSRLAMHNRSLQQKKKEEDADLHLAQRIMRNHKYSISGQADEEYDYDEGPRKKSRKKGGGNDHKATGRINVTKHVTQQERCQFCFENPNRAKHLVIAIANFAYLSLPNWEPVVAGHCCILTMQHESATRSVDDNVWNEIRNFKKCLIMMFGEQDKDVVFLETVMGLSKQRRHCLVECIPLPRNIAKQAPMYFKKAIDEAEDEWSQHNAKKLIDTSQKGLRGSIPKSFPYFYIEFGLDKGFVHVIDDEKEFPTRFGLNVIRGMLRLPSEDMHRRRKHEAVDKQNQAVASFVRDWEPFDWTKQLDS